MSVDDILQEVKTLTPEEQARLLDSLLVLMHRPDPSIDAAWAEEIDRRVDEVKSGTVKLIPAEEVFSKLRQRH